MFSITLYELNGNHQTLSLFKVMIYSKKEVEDQCNVLNSNLSDITLNWRSKLNCAFKEDDKKICFSL